MKDVQNYAVVTVDKAQWYSGVFEVSSCLDLEEHNGVTFQSQVHGRINALRSNRRDTANALVEAYPNTAIRRWKAGCLATKRRNGAKYHSWSHR
jgi:hypothetical protein